MPLLVGEENNMNIVCVKSINYELVNTLINLTFQSLHHSSVYSLWV